MTMELENRTTNGTLKQLLEAVTLGTYTSLCVIGRPGIGKSHTVLSELDRMGCDYFYLSGFSTPLSLFKLLYTHSNSVIVADDCEEVLASSLSTAMLKAAMDTKEMREVHWHSTSALMEENALEPSFVFNGKIILILNNLARKKPSIRALLSRSIVYELQPSRAELSEAVRRMAVTPLQQEVAEYIIRYSRVIDFRDFRKASALAEYYPNEWKPLVMELLRVSPEHVFVQGMMERELPTKSQVQLYTNRFGKTERSFYRVRKSLS